MIVVCNTSPLTSLAAIKQFNLLRHLYSQLLVYGHFVESKKKGLIKSLQPHLDDLRETAGFYITDSLYRSVLEVVGEK